MPASSDGARSGALSATCAHAGSGSCSVGVKPTCSSPALGSVLGIVLDGFGVMTIDSRCSGVKYVRSTRLTSSAVTFAIASYIASGVVWCAALASAHAKPEPEIDDWRYACSLRSRVFAASISSGGTPFLR